MSDLYISVTTLTQYIKRKFDVDPYMQKIWIKGEISNFRPSQRGHLYFTLKDDKFLIEAIAFSQGDRRDEIKIGDLIDVVCNVEVNTYNTPKTIQLVVQDFKKSI